MTVTITTTAGQALDVFTHAIGITAMNGSGTTICALRTTLDGTGQGDPTNGETGATIPGSGTGNTQLLLISNRIPVSAGAHTIRVQVSRLGGDYGCAIQSGSGRLWVTPR